MTEQKNVLLYAHGSSYNHGCEAIVRSSSKLLSLEKNKTTLFSNDAEGDYAFHLDDLVTVRQVHETPVARTSLLGISYRLRSRYHKDHVKYYNRYFGEKQFSYLYHAGESAISIGGDNYCYASAIDDLVTRNYWLNRKGIPTILWGASLTEEFMTPTVTEDMNRYSLIVVREHLSYQLLKEHNIQTEILCAPDPAFALDTQETPWPDGKSHKNVIGINISPFVTELSASENSGLRNYIRLIDWILKETDCEIALIPHVVYPDGSNRNDIETANMLLRRLPDSDRIFSIPDGYNCCQLKSLISKCAFFIGARTHSTIAAYSSLVPTIVVGYSVKSIGIARDLFGTDRDYVCAVQNMTDDEVLLNAFQRLYPNSRVIREGLASIVPDYLKGYAAAVDAANALIRK